MHRTISSRDARQGEVILRKPWQRGIFLAGLIAAVLFVAAGVLVG